MAISAEAGPRLAASVLARAPGRPVTDRALGRDRLTVLGYHRIVDPEALGDLHPGVVSATPAMFAHQMDRVARELTTTAAATTTTRRCRCRGRGAFPSCSSCSPGPSAPTA